MIMKETVKMKKYQVEYYGWIPSYRDFDSDDFTVEATSLKEAKEKAEATGKLRFAKYEPHIYEVKNKNENERDY